MSNCTSGCPTQDHASWGECLRSKGLRVGWSREAAGLDLTREKKWQDEIKRYRSAVRQGMDPNGTTTSAVRAAEQWSEKNGVAYSNENIRAVKEKRAFG